MIEIELENRSGVAVDERAVAETCRRILGAEGIEAGDLGVAFVGPEEMRALKREHLGIDESTDVLSFPIDGRDELPDGPPRQLGDVVLCPQVLGDAWGAPLVHGLLHLLGYGHGDAMRRRERELAGR
ncbi:MAG: rRNA maturation RNase YbeY [Actinobacteria bacterium]|nr:MAG: rRNA maturation RNase YbeY [Actinomycetota bacterium]